jgi:hypothetical protein
VVGLDWRKHKRKKIEEMGEGGKIIGNGKMKGTSAIHE